MNSVGIILILHNILLGLTFASDICTNDQYLNPSGICVDCTPCRGPKNVIIKPCHINGDTVCKSIVDSQKTTPNLKLNKNKKLSSLSKTSASRKSISTDVKENTSHENVSNHNFMLHVENNKVRKNNGVAKVRITKEKLKNGSLISVENVPELSKSKFPFNTSTKHIKKDLNLSSEISSKANQSLFKYVVKSKPSDVSKNVFNKNKSKQKKNKKDDALGVEDTEWMRHLLPYVENHRIYVDVEEVKPEKQKLRSHKNDMEIKPKLDVLSKSLVDVIRLRNKTDSLNFGENLYDPMNDKSDSMDYADENDIDDDYPDFHQDGENEIDDDEDEDEYDSDDNDSADDDDDNDDEDEDEDENGDDDDDDDDEDDVDEDDQDDEDIDDNEDKEDSNISSFLGGKDKIKFKPFGLNQDIISMNDADDEYSGDHLQKINKWHTTNEVNVEPFIDGSNSQILILVSAVSACLLFFIVVNTYLCIYMKKWRHMKQDFEADVEDLSVRINLMQHAGFEADESSNMKNYLKQLKGGKSSIEKVPKPIVRS